MTSIAKLLHKMPARQHLWNFDAHQVAATEFPDRHARTLRTCSLCGLIKVTVHGDGWVAREWRNKDGTLWQGRPGEPPCE